MSEDLPVRQMSDAHIAEAIRLCRQHTASEDATAEHELDMLRTHYLPVLDWLVAEAARRGIVL